jgi:tight adherence protein C
VLLALITFLLVASACFGLLLLFMRGGRNRDEEKADLVRGRRELIFGRLTPPLAGVWPIRAPIRERFTRWLRQAGHYHSQALTEFLALRNMLVLGAVLFFAAAIVVITAPGEAAMYMLGGAGLIAIVLLFAAPPLVLESMAAGRKRRIEESLPDAMDMITMCTSAGLPLQHSISKVSDEIRTIHPDLSYELRLVGHHTEAGSLNTAIQQFAKRMDNPEIHSVAAMVWQAEKQGASVAGAFHTFADQVRLNRRQRAEEAGNKAAFKMLFPLVFCLAPAVYLILLAPAVMELRDTLQREKQAGGALATSPQDVGTLFDQTTIMPSGVPPGAAAPAAQGPAAPAGQGPAPAAQGPAAPAGP